MTSKQYETNDSILLLNSKQTFEKGNDNGITYNSLVCVKIEIGLHFVYNVVARQTE